MKKITVFRDGQNYGATIMDGRVRVMWEDLTRAEQLDLLDAMAAMSSLFSRYIKEDKQ